MSYLNFDKTLLMNLDKSLSKEMIRTNRAGAYNSTTLIDCNTRKYHGQLVVPLPDIDDSIMCCFLRSTKRLFNMAPNSILEYINTKGIISVRTGINTFVSSIAM